MDIVIPWVNAHVVDDFVLPLFGAVGAGAERVERVWRDCGESVESVECARACLCLCCVDRLDSAPQY